MVESTQGSRPYDSRGRRAQAQANRDRILAAAQRLFVERGFAGTSIADIALAAQVSTPTVFAHFGSKALLLKEAAETALVGDAQPVPLAQRPEMVHVREGRTPQEVIARFAALVAQAGPRSVPVAMVMYRAADANPELAEVVRTLDGHRLQGAAALAALILPEGDEEHLAELRDLIWTVNAPVTFDLLVHQRGWPPQRYARWVTEVLGSAADRLRRDQ